LSVQENGLERQCAKRNVKRWQTRRHRAIISWPIVSLLSSRFPISAAFLFFTDDEFIAWLLESADLSAIYASAPSRGAFRCRRAPPGRLKLNQESGLPF
jgi:hypothetical protein